MNTAVKQMVKECVECQKSNLVKQGKDPLHNLPVITTPFERVAVDIVGPDGAKELVPFDTNRHGYSLS